MIALVSGTVAVRRADHVVVDCGGVGYRLAVSAETLRHVPAVGKRRRSCTRHLVVRDDALALYGFATEEERELFLMLLGGPVGRPEGRARGALRRAAAGAAGGGRRRRHGAASRPSPGSASGPQSGSSSSCARRSAPRRARPRDPDHAVSDDPRALARDGLLELGYSAQEVDELLDGAEGDRAEDLIAHALRTARR